MESISKDMIIGDVLAKHPYLAEYIMDLGVHCVGCGIAMYETLEEGFMGHGMMPEEIDESIRKLNEVIKEQIDTQNAIIDEQPSGNN